MPTQKWEYAEMSGGRNTQVRFTHRSPRSGGFWELWKQLGDEGWELVGVTGVGGTPVDFQWLYVFKRPQA